MVLKTRSKGLTIIELIAAMAVVSLLLAVLILNVNVPKNQSAARDARRLSDLTMLDRAINEYMLDNRDYPDTPNVLRSSVVLPPGGAELQSSSAGWISQDLTGYLPKLPTDPLNDETYHYLYMRNDSGYELDAKLEGMADQMQNDGGNDPNMYEMGNILTLMSP